ncbi:HD-GYP domain, c-di-GMP phosphodiesterase class II (or its inactivated variant) [Tindallia magadiensis]|uniref:HD-GYP domain, c-di-GMP phosphodiesterase class II (Or its inactivated variant) n=1 Tax=Tindallia magadiensis TaxID=69895 RepID=A0A1I3CXJ5_9FIRM|nr:HD domain-containing phosphohydrolase [Tindallia magadiensis]SFH79163.1 HD-GYP domain, c-di-GMP phosphodiesterase class II (or its inactivated variant) [Tindallia magadiensis]
MSNPIKEPKESYRTLQNLDELKSGMVIAEDVFNKNGHVLIAAGFVVDDVAKLKQFLTLHKVDQVRIRLHATKYPVKAKKPKQEPVTPAETQPLDLTAREEARLQKKRQMETKAFQDRYQVQKETIKTDFQRMVKGEEVSKDRLEAQVIEILKSYDGTVNVFQLIETIKKDYRDLYAHYYQVTIISHSIGTWLELTPPQMKNLTLSALLHDLGKEQLSPELILAQNKLSTDEELEYQKHVVIGYELAKHYDFINYDMLQAILLHHERSDGSGYPLGLKQEKIPLLARIIAIADVYNTLTSPNSKGEKKTPFEAVKIMESEYMDQLDTRILYIFLNRIGNCFLGQLVHLNDGRVGEVIFVPRVYVYRPIIKLKPTNQLIDLSHRDHQKISIKAFAET